MFHLGVVAVTSFLLPRIASLLRDDGDNQHSSETPLSGVSHKSLASLAEAVVEGRNLKAKPRHFQIQQMHTYDDQVSLKSKMSGEQKNFKVAVLSPLNCTHCTRNARDALTGWDLWLKAINNIVELPDGTPVQIDTDLFPYEDGEESLKAVAEHIDPKEYHLVIGTSTHFFKQVLEVMQDKKMLNIQCEGGDPDVWSKFAQDANGKFYGFGIHSSFKKYPEPFFQHANDVILQTHYTHASHLKAKDEVKAFVAKPTVALVGEQKTHFAKAVCDAAKKSAEALGFEVSNFTDIVEGGRFLDADILYGCTMNEDGIELMQVISRAGNRHPPAISLTIAPAKPWFRTEFGSDAAFITYPGQWHFTSDYACTDQTFCPKSFKSVEDFRKLNNEVAGDGEPSYMRASCAVAGVAVETAMRSLDASDFAADGDTSNVQEKLFTALSTMNTTSFFGELAFDDVTQMSDRPASIVQYHLSQNCTVEEVDLGKKQLCKLWTADAEDVKRCAKRDDEPSKRAAARPSHAAHMLWPAIALVILRTNTAAA